MQIHLVFYILLLEPAHLDSQVTQEPIKIDSKGKEIYKLEKVLSL